MTNEELIALEKELAGLLYPNRTILNDTHRVCVQYDYDRKLSDVWVPQWTRDNAAAFELMVEHELDITLDRAGVAALDTDWPECVKYSHFSEFKDKSQATRVVIVKAVIAKLKLIHKGA